MKLFLCIMGSEIFAESCDLKARLLSIRAIIPFIDISAESFLLAHL